MESWLTFLILIIACLIVQGFFSMVEMACVSFNRVRLQYYVSKNQKRAIWLNYLLKRPALLFGTALIGISFSLQLGSEAARRFYLSVHLVPDYAPISQFILVILFAEIAPLFAGRRYAEHVVMIGIPILYALSFLLRPVIWSLDLLCKGINRLLKSPGKKGIYLTREELQKVLEEQEVVKPKKERQELNTIVANIFHLKQKRAKEIMLPMKSVRMASALCTVREMREMLSQIYTPNLPIYHKGPENIVAIAYPRDLLRAPDNARIRDYARPPWFVAEDNTVFQILKQFRVNNRSLGVVLDKAGKAIGIITLDEILDEIFGAHPAWMPFDELGPRMQRVIVDRTFPAEMTIVEFNTTFQVNLPSEGVDTLGDLVELKLGHPPTKGESVRLDQFELTVEEAALRGAKEVSVRTIF